MLIIKKLISVTKCFCLDWVVFKRLKVKFTLTFKNRNFKISWIG